MKTGFIRARWSEKLKVSASPSVAAHRLYSYFLITKEKRVLNAVR
jgi:hypothetical protein